MRGSATGRREDLLRREAEGYGRIDALIAGLDPPQLARPGLNAEGWAIRDLLWHLAAWSEDTARVLGEMAAGTWNGEDPSLQPGWTDLQNARQLERSRGLDPAVAPAAWRRQRASMVEAFGALVEIGPDAAEWFEESGPSHYDEHLPSLEAWVREILGPGPARP